MDRKRKQQVDENMPTTMLTQIGVISCLPKMARNETTMVTNKKHGTAKPSKVT